MTRTIPGPFVGKWILLFPATYLGHIGEEFWGGFPACMAAFTGVAMPEAAFLAANALFWLLLSGAVALVLRQPSRAALVVALATIVTINASLHVGASLLSASYSPGLITAVVLWLPLGVVALVRGRRLLARGSFRSGVLVGAAVHVLVPAVALGLALVVGGG